MHVLVARPIFTTYKSMQLDELVFSLLLAFLLLLV